jgi:hypothetical protein
MGLRALASRASAGARPGLTPHREACRGGRDPGWHTAPERRTPVYRLRAIAAVLVWCLAASPAVADAAKGAGRPALVVVARNLNNPRKIFVGPDGAIYVVEAGTGGRRTCLGSGPRAVCIGLTGSVARIENGKQATVLEGLPSFAAPDGHAAQGASDVIVRRGTYYVLLGDSSINSIGANDLGPDGTTAGDLISTPSGRAKPTMIASLAAFEASNNPDHGAGPGAGFGDPKIDSNPYAVTPYRGGFAVADAAANDLLWLSPRGAISVLAVFPTQTERLTPALARRIGAPPTMRSIRVQAVPTSVAVGPDGALYVGELTGVPYEPGTARVWRIDPGNKMSVYASGFTNIVDLAFDDGSLLVLEVASQGLLHPNSRGALIRLRPDGRRTVLATAGLVDPTGVAVEGKAIYISNFGVFPGAGSGPHGELVRVSGPVGS